MRSTDFDELLRSFRVFHKLFGYFLKISPYLFLVGIVGMLMGDIFVGDQAGQLVYMLTAFPVISFWLIGTGVLMAWSMLVGGSADRDRVLSSFDGILWFLAGWTLAAVGLFFFFMGIWNW